MHPHYVCVVFNHQLCISLSGDFFCTSVLANTSVTKIGEKCLRKDNHKGSFSLLMIACTKIITPTSTTFFISFFCMSALWMTLQTTKNYRASVGEKSSRSVHHSKAWLCSGHCQFAKQMAPHLWRRSADDFYVLWLKSPLYEMPEQLWPFQLRICHTSATRTIGGLTLIWTQAGFKQTDL